MIRTPSGKNLMNLQEAVQWLLDNNALPFQCTANYVGGAEIGLGTIVNPTPAKVRVGSLIFFADSKVSTVIGITSNSFICSFEYNDLVDDVVYVANVALNASGHLIVTLSNGEDIDAGLIKQVTGFSINGSQHLIISYNDGTSTDLGAIFTGNINIAGNFTADSIIENMSGYSYNKGSETTNITREIVYAGAVKNGNKVTFVVAMNVTKTATITDPTGIQIGYFNIPSAVGTKLYPTDIGGNNFLDVRKITLAKSHTSMDSIPAYCEKWGDQQISLRCSVNDSQMDLNVKYYVRYELTFLLSDPLNS